MTEMIRDQLREQAGLVKDAQGTPVAPTLPAGQLPTPTAVSTEGTTVTAPAALDVSQEADVRVDAEKTAAAPIVATVPDAERAAAATYTAEQVKDAPEITAAKLTAAEVSPSTTVDAQAIIDDSGISDEAVAQAAQVTQENFDRNATVKYQLEQLFQSLDNAEDPSQLPPWAGPAYRAVNAQMAARGMGGSSMAAAAMMTALYEAGLPIAKSDADTYQAIQISNLNNRQQTVLQNAMMYAAMDKAELDARSTAALNNARSFLSIDLQNLTNEQKTAEIDYQGSLQTLFTDQAATNAARAFNAESQTQVDQFYEQLNVSVETANANRKAANEQFNVNEANAMNQFVASTINQREQFNANMQAQIDQSNASWRRQANTIDTQATNEANRINAQNLFNLTSQAQNQLWQEYRDSTQWAMQTAENAADRNHQMAIAAMEIDENVDLYDTKMLYDTAQSIGSFAYEVWGEDVKSWLKGDKGNP